MLTKSRIKDIQSLAAKKQREETGLFLLEGPKLVLELLQFHRAQVEELFALSEWAASNHSTLNGVKLTLVTPPELTRISQLSTPNQVVAVVKQMPLVPLEAKGTLTLVCCGIQDPGNLGTIIRTADWFGVQQIICSEDTVDLYNPKVVQSTMGSIFRVQLCYTNVLHWIKQQGKVPVYASLLQGEDVTALTSQKEGILLIGNESKGIPDELIELATHKISIPGKGKAESLNAAVATGIILSYLS
jgi:TrmH family RNA methyltransferase